MDGTTQKVSYKYQDLKSHLITQISAGALAGGTRVGSENELGTQFNLSRNTVRQALKELENEGYLYRIQGKGTFVRDARPHVSRKIALMIYDSSYATHPVTSALIRGVSEALAEKGYFLDILASRRSFHDENLTKLSETYAGFLIGAYQMDELIVQELDRTGSPYLFVKNYLPSRMREALRIDFEHAGFELAEHIIRTGRQELALIHDGASSPIAMEFRDGVFSACMEYGVRLRKQHVFESRPDDPGQVARIVNAVTTGPDRVEAVICPGDAMALEIITELARRGIRVPDDMAVSGLNNSDISSVVRPSLTTVDIPTFELGRVAADMIVARINGDRPPMPAPIRGRLIVRESTRQVPAADKIT